MMLKPLENDEIEYKGEGPGGFFEPFHQGTGTYVIKSTLSGTLL